jgi:uncharacterized membrane protein
MRRSTKALGAFFVFAGAMHFIRPRAYEAIVPPYVSRPREAVQISGAAELAGGFAALHPATRPVARWWLLGLLLAVFPANVHMALHPDEVAMRGVPADRIPAWLLWARLPIQPLFMLWTWRATAR